MPTISLKNVTKRWGKFYGTDNINLEIEDNAFVTILGPSGCGKTTTLRMIAGLETPTSGQIKIGDTVVFDSEQGINIPANKRKVGFLFQNYALWPNMTVYENISFGLKNVKEEMPVVDEEAKVTSALIKAVDNSKKIKDINQECIGKDGKLDSKQQQLKLIDAFTLSQYSAKTLADMNLDKASESELASKKESLQNKLDSLLKAHKDKGEELSENFEVIKNGEVVKEVRKLSKEEIDQAVRRVSRIVKIGMFMDRYPAELSGGQQQRVAIARTLAPEPQVMFMDEPLSNLDAKLRLEMRYELQRLHVETGSTFVYVTHDQMEAMTLSTKMCLMNNGVIQQYDAPLVTYNTPNNLFTADFVGNPSINFVEANGVQEDGSIKLNLLDKYQAKFIPNESLDLNSWYKQRDEDILKAQEEEKNRNDVEKENKDEVFAYHVALVDEDYSSHEEVEVKDGDFVLGIRPERIIISDTGKIKATVYGAMPTGMESTLKLKVENYLLTSVIFGGVTYDIGSEVNIDIDSDAIMLFDRKSGRLIATGKLEI